MERILANMNRVYRDELLVMKEEHDKQIKYETIEHHVKEIVCQVRNTALQGKTYYVVEDRLCQQMKFMEETVSVLREVFQDCDIEYKEEESNIPSRNPNVIMKQIIRSLKIDWSA